jgi:hypothetical protein
VPRVRPRGLLVLGSTSNRTRCTSSLALPDFLGFDSVLSMARDHGETVGFALRLNSGQPHPELVGGRAIYLNTVVGGFARVPSRTALETVPAAEAVLDPLLRAADTVAAIPVPEWGEQRTIYMALRPYETPIASGGRAAHVRRP